MQKKGKKKWWIIAVSAVVVAAAVVLIILAPWKNGGEKSTSRPVVTALIASSQLPAEQNTVLTALCDATDIDFRPIVVENGDYEERYNTLAASDSLPDIFTASTSKTARELVENGVILPLDDLLEQYGQEIISNRGDQFADCPAMIDGKLYGIPTKIYSSGNALMVRQDWLDNLGMEVPTTIDQFYETCKAFTFNDPDQDGQEDTIAISAAMSFSTTVSFLYGMYGVPFKSQSLVDDQVVPYFMHPNWLERTE